jgi:hypothetical protein
VASSMSRNRSRWIIAARCLLVLAVLCTIASASLYYLPDLPRMPRPDLGGVYAVQNHYTVIYWNEKQLLAHRALSVAAVSLFAFAFLIGVRLGELKWLR